MSRRPAELAATVVSGVVLVGLWAGRWCGRSCFPYEWDSASYALGARHFDVTQHHPHPPGYPLYILALKAASIVTSDLNAAQVVLAFVVTGAAAALTGRFVRQRHGLPAALVASSMLLFAPSVALYSVVASTYPLDLLGSVVVGSLAARLWDGERAAAPETVFALAVFAGFRESGAAMMAPLVVVALARALQNDVRRWLLCAAVGVTTTSSWYVPTALMHGGLAAYQALCDRTIRGYFAQMSVLYGAPASTHAAMLGNAARWAAATFFVALVVSAAVLVVGRFCRGAPPDARPRRLAVAFYALWLAPNVLYVTLLQCMKPGYLLLSVPPVVILLAGGMASSLDAIALRARTMGAAVAPVVACAAGLLGTVVATHDFRSMAFQRTSLASITEGDLETRAIQSYAAADTMVLYTSWPWYGPTPQSTMLLHPEATVAIALPSGRVEVHERGAMHEEAADDVELAAGVRRVLFVCESSQEQGVPLGVRRVFAGRRTTAFVAEVGEGTVDALAGWQSLSFHLVRAN